MDIEGPMRGHGAELSDGALRQIGFKL